jgi:hypothetical protein
MNGSHAVPRALQRWLYVLSGDQEVLSGFILPIEIHPQGSVPRQQQCCLLYRVIHVKKSCCFELE